jgi:hypothetical protein
MEEKQRNIENEIDLTLESFNDIKPAEVNPYLFEKVMNRIQNRKQVNFFPKLRYALIISLLILVNILTFIYFSGSIDETIADNDDIKNTFKNEYSLTVNSYNY